VKYIILAGPNGEAPVLFPREFMHRYVAELFSPMPVVAAGFVRSTPDGPECYGTSSGLKIVSRGNRDTALVAEALKAGEPGGQGG